MEESNTSAGRAINHALAIRSSNHRDRTQRDRKTDRAFHLMRFFGTNEETPAPPFDGQPRVRREVVEPPAVELTEQEKKMGLAMTGQRPGESAEAYEIRKQVMRRARHQEDTWKWVLEDYRREDRWEGKEDLTQTSHYVVMFPPTEHNGVYKVALLDHWIDMRKAIDNSEQKKKLRDEIFQRNIQMKMKQNTRNAARHLSGDARVEKSKTRWVGGTESEATTKRYKSRGVIDSDDEDDDDKYGTKSNQRGVSIEDVNGEYDKVDHEHGLAIDRMQEDGDEFQDVEYEFDDDEEVVDEQIAAEDKDGLLEGGVVVEEAALLDAEEDFEDENEDEDEEPSRPLSSSESEEEEEDEEEEESPPRPSSQGVSRPSLPPAMAAAAAAAAAASNPARVSVVPQQPKPKTLEQQMKDFIIERMRLNQAKTEMKTLLKSIKDRFRAEFDKATVQRLISQLLILKKNDIDGDYFVLRDEYL